MIQKKSLFALAKVLEGVPLLGVLEGTPAARAGVRYGDIILSVNGMRTRDVADYVEAKNLRSDGMDLIVFRNGVETSLSFGFDAPAESVEPAALVESLRKLRVLGEVPDRDGDGEDG